MWIIEIGKERIEETIDLKLTIERVLEIYLKKDIESSKGNKRRVQRLNELLEACQGWNVDELEVEEL